MSDCLVKCDCRVISEPMVKADYGIEKIYESIVEIAGVGKKRNHVTLDYSNSIGVNLSEGDIIYIEGDIRSIRHRTEMDMSPLKVYLFANTIEILPSDSELSKNSIELTGTVSNKPYIRKAFNNNKTDVAELTVKLMRTESRFSYIPVIAWNSLARLTVSLQKGESITLKGNIQSHYTSNGRLMIEVSAYSISKIDE